MEPKRIEEIYDEIARYTINLEHDPVALGPRYLQKVTAECRNYQNAVSRIIGEIQREKRGVAEQLRAHEAAYKVSFEEMLANDDRVRRLPNIADRTATINVYLAEDIRKIDDLQRTLLNLDHVDKAVRHRHNELKSTSADIRLQRSLIRDELDTKSFYGDETDTTPAGTYGRRQPEIDEEIEAILAAGNNAIEQGSDVIESGTDVVSVISESVAPVAVEPVAHQAPIAQVSATETSEKGQGGAEMTKLALSDEEVMQRFLAGVPATQTAKQGAASQEDELQSLLDSV